jgi:ABC-type multidrug transport system fused ATPase/permease subunit
LQALVLNKFNLTVREGEVVALVGSSGGGKSSIMKLIKRVYEPKSGSIFLDGQPLSCYDNAWLQNNIAAVTQEPVLHDCRLLCASFCSVFSLTPNSPSLIF